MTGPDAGLIVRDVTVRAVVVPLRRPLATRVGDFPRWPLVLIDVRTEQGIIGRSGTTTARTVTSRTISPAPGPVIQPPACS